MILTPVFFIMFPNCQTTFWQHLLFLSTMCRAVFAETRQKSELLFGNDSSQSEDSVPFPNQMAIKEAPTELIWTANWPFWSVAVLPCDGWVCSDCSYLKFKLGASIRESFAANQENFRNFGSHPPRNPLNVHRDATTWSSWCFSLRQGSIMSHPLQCPPPCTSPFGWIFILGLTGDKTFSNLYPSPTATGPWVNLQLFQQPTHQVWRQLAWGIGYMEMSGRTLCWRCELNGLVLHIKIVVPSELLQLNIVWREIARARPKNLQRLAPVYRIVKEANLIPT